MWLVLGNKYLTDRTLENGERKSERVQTQMYVALQIASALAILSEPFYRLLLLSCVYYFKY